MRTLRNYLDDIFYWIGALLISFGVYSLLPSAGFIVLGGFCTYFGFLIGRARANQ